MVALVPMAFHNIQQVFGPLFETVPPNRVNRQGETKIMLWYAALMNNLQVQCDLTSDTVQDKTI
jgi:hypothetical protein